MVETIVGRVVETTVGRTVKSTVYAVEPTDGRAVKTQTDENMGNLEDAVKGVADVCSPNDRKTLLPREQDTFLVVDRVLDSMNASPRVSDTPDDVSDSFSDTSIHSDDDDDAYETSSDNESEGVVDRESSRDEVPLQIPVPHLPGRADDWEPVNPGKDANDADVKAGLVYAIMAVFYCVAGSIFRTKYNRGLPKQDARGVKAFEERVS